jgi:hypothetical protein
MSLARLTTSSARHPAPRRPASGHRVSTRRALNLPRFETPGCETPGCETLGAGAPGAAGADPDQEIPHLVGLGTGTGATGSGATGAGLPPAAPPTGRVAWGVSGATPVVPGVKSGPPAIPDTPGFVPGPLTPDVPGLGTNPPAIPDTPRVRPRPAHTGRFPIRPSTATAAWLTATPARHDVPSVRVATATRARIYPARHRTGCRRNSLSAG